MDIVTEIVGGKSYEYIPLGEYVVRAVGVCGGRPTFKYTRIEVAGTLGRVAASENIDAIAEGYRGRVPREAILEAIDISATNGQDGANHNHDHIILFGQLTDSTDVREMVEMYANPATSRRE